MFAEKAPPLRPLHVVFWSSSNPRPKYAQSYKSVALVRLKAEEPGGGKLFISKRCRQIDQFLALKRDLFEGTTERSAAARTIREFKEQAQVLNREHQTACMQDSAQLWPDKVYTVALRGIRDALVVVRYAITRGKDRLQFLEVINDYREENGLTRLPEGWLDMPTE